MAGGSAKSSKLEVSTSLDSSGVMGAGTERASSAAQSRPSNQGCARMSSAPLNPSRSSGFTYEEIES